MLESAFPADLLSARRGRVPGEESFSEIVGVCGGRYLENWGNSPRDRAKFTCLAVAMTADDSIGLGKDLDGNF
jgi:hypothetical protein